MAGPKICINSWTPFLSSTFSQHTVHCAFCHFPHDNKVILAVRTEARGATRGKIKKGDFNLIYNSLASFEKLESITYGLMSTSNMSFTSKYWNEKELIFSPLPTCYTHHRKKRLRFPEELRKSVSVYVKSLQGL